MKTQTYGLSNELMPRGHCTPSNGEDTFFGGAREHQDAHTWTALGNYIANRGNGEQSDNPSQDLPVDGTWSWQEKIPTYCRQHL